MLSVSMDKKKYALARQIECQLLFLPMVIVIIAAIGFLIKKPINHFDLWISCLFTLALTWIINKKIIHHSHKTYAFSLFISMMILTVFFLISACFISSAWGGFAYHQPTIIALCKGWNPFQYPDIRAWINKTGIFAQSEHLISINQFGMASEFIAAIFYKAIPIFEASKFYNLIFILLIGMAAFRFLSRFESLSKKQIYLLTIALAINPVAAYQAMVFYVDGQFASALTLFLILLLEGVVFSDTLSLIETGAVFILLVNMKMSGLAFGSLMALGFFLYILFENKSFVKKYLLVFFLSFVLAFAVVGYYPYLTNTIHHFNPFASVMNHAFKKGLYSGLTPSFKEANRFIQFFISLFANKYWNMDHFVRYSKGIIIFPQDYDTQVAGFGLIFGYLFMIGLALLFFIRKRVFLWASLILLLTIFMIDGAWWARIVPQTWLIPILIVAGILVGKKYPKCLKLSNVMLSLLVINAVAIFLLSTIYQVGRSYKTNHYLSQLRRTDNIIAVEKAQSNIAHNRLLNAYGIKVKIQDHVNCRAFIHIPHLVNAKYCPNKDIII